VADLVFKINDHPLTAMECTPGPRPGNLQRAEWRSNCGRALSDHIRMLCYDLWTVLLLTKL
jgi:hypothetical protein